MVPNYMAPDGAMALSGADSPVWPVAPLAIGNFFSIDAAVQSPLHDFVAQTNLSRTFILYS